MSIEKKLGFKTGHKWPVFFCFKDSRTNLSAIVVLFFINLDGIHIILGENNLNDGIRLAKEGRSYNQLFYTMNNTMKNCSKWMMISAFGLLTAACTEREDETLQERDARATLSITAQGESTASSHNNSRIIVNGFSVSQFQVATKDVEMRYLTKADLLGNVGIGGINLRTNVNASLQTDASEEQSLVLISQGNARTEMMGQGNTPEGAYREVSFRLINNTTANETNATHGKSVYLVGTINDQPSQIWLTSEKVLEAKSENEAGVEVEGETDMVLVFDLQKLFEGVNFSTAIDTDADGIIEIGSGGDAGNAAIVTQIESNLESSVIFKRK